MVPPDTTSDDPAIEGVNLTGVVLGDARTGELFDLGAAHPLVVLAVIRHRY